MSRKTGRSPIATVLAAAALVLASACTRAAAPGEGTEGPPSGREWKDLAYGTVSGAQKLDLYLPASGEGPFPVVVWLHGGGWKGGDKRLAGAAPPLLLRSRGFAIASVNYRLTGEAAFPAQINDVKAAVRWLRANARQYRLDPGRIGAWGISAGGHLAALLGTSGGVAALEGAGIGNGGESSRVEAVVDWFGPADLPRFEEHGAATGCREVKGLEEVAALLGGSPAERPQAARAASPLTYVTPDDPPFLIQHGTEDCTVPWLQSEVLKEALAAAAGEQNVSLTLLPAGHSGVAFETDANLLQIARFFEERLS